MSIEKDGIALTGALIGMNPEDRLFYILQIDKEHHAVYATLIEQDKQAIREIVREELQRFLAQLQHNDS